MSNSIYLSVATQVHGCPAPPPRSGGGGPCEAWWRGGRRINRGAGNESGRLCPLRLAALATSPAERGRNRRSAPLGKRILDPIKCAGGGRQRWARSPSPPTPCPCG